MEHYVFLRFAQRCPAKHALAAIIPALEGAKNALDGFLSYRLMQGGGDTALIVLSFTSAQDKDAYLAHPFHTELLRQLKPNVVEKEAFDSEGGPGPGNSPE